MSAMTVYQGLEAAWRTIPGLSNILLGSPTAIHETPALYTAYQSFTRVLRNNPPARNLTGMDHIYAARLIIQWQDNQSAEMQLLTLLDAIPDAIDRDPNLGGKLPHGTAYCSDGVSGFVRIGDIDYRIVDYVIHCLEKREN